MSHCAKCGAALLPDALFCGSCGEQLLVTHVHSDQEAIVDKIQLLKQELDQVEDALEIQSFGFYQPRYDFGSSEQYAERLKVVRDGQKKLIRLGQATVSPRDWVVDGSLARGRQMMAEQTKLMLRAFNGDCDAAISRTKYDNVARLEKRIEKAFAAINALGGTKKISISDEYLRSKLDELYLVHEHREKVYQEQEEQRLIREEMREEQRAEKEIQKALADAEKEEARFAAALQKARDELAESTGKQHDKLEALVQKLETELSAAIDRKAKSIARAQLVRSGHVYVLSNIGSFGEGVYKIGMTRRFDPLERVHELGGASVPFRFDVHAMIYSEDAPALEASLHRELEAFRVNKVNLRREYFRVSLEQIRAAVEKQFGHVTFVTLPQAEEYRKTLAAQQR